MGEVFSIEYLSIMTPNQFVEHHLKKLDNYISDVVNGAITVNAFELLAVERFLKHKEKYIYKESEVVKALRFFSILNIQINNRPQQAEVMDFQMLWLASIVGLYKKNNDERLYSQSFILVAKKNSKSTFGAMLALYFAIGQGILNSHVLMVGASRDQAKTLIRYIEFIVKNSPFITDLFKVNKNIIKNNNETSTNRIEIRSSDAGTINSVGVGLGLSLIDEFAYHKDGLLQQSIKSAQIAQSNHHQLIISTTSNNLSSPAFEFYEAAKNVLNGVITNDDLFTVIYSLDSKDEYKDPANYRKSNPAIGKTVTIDAIKREVDSAISLPAKLETVLNHHFNIWHNQHQDNFIDDEQVQLILNAEKEIPSGATVYLGADFSSLNDLSALCVLYFDQDSKEFIGRIYHIFPNNEKRKIKKGNVDLQRWIDENYIIRCESKSLDENLVVDLITDINSKYQIKTFGFDPFNARIIANRLESELGINCKEVRQNFTLSHPLKLIERYIAENKLSLDKSPVTRWQFQNLIIKTDRNNNYLITKSKGESVDGIVALTVAMAVYLEDNYSNFKSVLDVFDFK